KNASELATVRESFRAARPLPVNGPATAASAAAPSRGFSRDSWATHERVDNESVHDRYGRQAHRGPWGQRSEERRVGKKGRSRGGWKQDTKKKSDDNQAQRVARRGESTGEKNPRYVTVPR